MLLASPFATMSRLGSLMIAAALWGCGSADERSRLEAALPAKHDPGEATATRAALSADAPPPASPPAETVPTCTRGALTVRTVSPTSGPVSAHTTIVFDVSVENNDSAGCEARVLLFAPNQGPAEFSMFVSPTFEVAEPARDVHFEVSWTATTEAQPGSYQLSFRVLDLATGDAPTGTLTYELAPPPDCFVRPSRELLVNDLSVVEDPVRTSFDDWPGDLRAGSWTFGRLMENLAPTPEAAADMTEQLFETWRSDQEINGFTVAARPVIDSYLLSRWPRDADGRLDLHAAPLRLLAIVNRMDIRSLRDGHAGQGRFVFGVVDPFGLRTPFTVILEYRLPARTIRDALAWARAWHSLGALPFPSEAYSERLQEITERFSGRGADPRGVNGSALATLRTDEIALEAPWELRQFALSRDTGGFVETTVDGTPDLSLQGTPVLADFINDFGASIGAGLGHVPKTFDGVPFRGGSALNELQAWDAPGIADPRARRAFSMQTCNGCHGAPESGTEFVHVAPRNLGVPSGLSGFLLGLALPDPITGELRTFNDLDRRKLDLEGLVCGTPTRVDKGVRWAHFEN
jgi:hypothetical protein